MENVRVSPGKAVSVGEVSLENKTGNSIVVRYDKARKTVLLVDLLSRRTRKMKNGKLLAAGLVLLADFFLAPVIPRQVDVPCQGASGTSILGTACESTVMPCSELESQSLHHWRVLPNRARFCSVC